MQVPFSTAAGGRVERALRRAQSRLVVLNKSDLACDALAPTVRTHLQGEGLRSVHLDARQPDDIRRLLQLVRKRAAECQRQAEFQTMPCRMAVVGVPNTGKSTLLNQLRRSATRSKGRAKTGDTPGVTKHLSYSRISHRPPVLLLDTPGIMPPGNLASETGLALALTGGVADKLLEPAVLADFLLFHLNRQRCSGYARRYAMPGPADSVEQVLDAIVAARGVLVRSGKQRRADLEAQRQRAAMLMVRDFRKGRLGRLTIDDVPEAVVGRHNTRPAPGRATPRD